MEPQIGIRGRVTERLKPPKCSCFNGAPDRNPGKGQSGTAEDEGVGFNGAPDRNPGKGGADLHGANLRGRFNGAPDRNRGRYRHMETVSGSSGCFNGAPDRNPGKAMMLSLMDVCGSQWGFNGAPDRNPGKGSYLQKMLSSIWTRFNGAPDRNPGKAVSRPKRARTLRQVVVSMEPQIGIRGRDVGVAPSLRGTGVVKVSMEPQIGIRGRLSCYLHSTTSSLSFNGAPDRNPGRGLADGAVSTSTTFQWSPR